jgi:hypothetical protein
LGLTVSAQQERQSSQPQTTIKILPEKPTPNDEIKIELSGTFPNTCTPEEESVKVTVDYNQVTVATSNASEYCDEATTKWSLSVPVGKKLIAGPYRVLVLFRMTKEPPDLLLGIARFDVAEKSANTDQVRQATSAPFTTLPLLQTLDNSPWVPSGPLFATTVKGTKSNTDNRVALPGTTGTTVGEELTLSLNLKELETSGFQYSHCDRENSQGLTFGKEVPCIRPPVCPPNCPTEYVIAIQITETDPILKLSFEQVELPDLEARLSLNLRRYTEGERVFCDVTGLAIVRNIGKGPAGPVLEAVMLNLSKSNVNRWGLNPSGGQMTVPVVDLRLSPGIYQYEISAQLKAGKEKDIKNNEARQAITCR